MDMDRLVSLVWLLLHHLQLTWYASSAINILSKLNTVFQASIPFIPMKVAHLEHLQKKVQVSIFLDPLHLHIRILVGWKIIKCSTSLIFVGPKVSKCDHKSHLRVFAASCCNSNCAHYNNPPQHCSWGDSFTRYRFVYFLMPCMHY